MQTLNCFSIEIARIFRKISGKILKESNVSKYSGTIELLQRQISNRILLQVGFCPYGPRCHFVHNQDEVAIQKAAPQVTALLNARTTAAVASRSRPAALSPSLSLDSPSPPCSLSQSPTSSMGSFFSSEPELHSPGVEDQRLPVFNRLIDTAQLLSLSELML